MFLLFINKLKDFYNYYLLFINEFYYFNWLSYTIVSNILINGALQHKKNGFKIDLVISFYFFHTKI